MSISFRKIVAGAAFAGIFLGSWWISALGALLLSIRWRAWEVIVLGSIVDIVWLPYGMFYGIPVATCMGILLVWLFEPLRRQFLFTYDD